MVVSRARPRRRLATFPRKIKPAAVAIPRLDLDDGDGFNFYARAKRERCNLHGGPGRWVGREVFGIDAVHGSEIMHVGQEDRRLDDFGQRRAGCRQNS